MRHLKAHRKLGRTTEHRMSMLRNLATSLINSQEDRIVTTLPKARELRPFVERVITLSRRARSLTRDDADAQVVHLRRQAAGFFHAGNTQQVSLTGKRGQQRLARTAGVAALKRLFDELGERYKDRPGGYTRILKLGTRAGDNAELAIIELVGNQRELEAVEAAKKRTKTSGVKKKGATEGKGVSARRGPKPYEKKETRETSEVIEASRNQTEDEIEVSEPKSSTEDDPEVAS